MKNIENNKYFLYARKSTESDERQVQSIEDQLKTMKKIANERWYKIIWEFIESKSAKIPYQREKFNNMIECINNWKVNGIISFHLNRISRNPIDSATIQYMLQNNTLNKVVTYDKEYLPADSWLIMSLINWMSNQYILDLVVAVKRWLNSKYEKWIRPSLVPIWYKNDVINRTIITDEERVQTVRKMWNLMLTGSYSIQKVIDKANNEWWLRTVKKKKVWWWPLTKSSWQRIFRNIFYTWYFERNWELVRWIHEPIITIAEYNRVQSLLSKWGKAAPIKKEFSYTWMIDCWVCWCRVTWEIKNKYIKATWETREYTYYHCTRKRKDMKCSQKSIRIENIEEQIANILKSIEIEPEFKEWVFATIKENYNSEFESRIKIFENLNNAIISEDKRLKRLTDMYLDSLINKEGYKNNKQEIEEKIENLKNQRNKIDLKGQKSMQLTEWVFEFAIDIVESFNSGDLQRKRDVLNSLGKNFILKDWVLWLELEPWYKVIQDEASEAKIELRELEPTKKAIRFLKTDDFSLNRFKWWDIRGSNPGPSP